MYEGKNIHYSSFDSKPLCSFSSKVCNQHRLNGYAFCVRHILEDPTAPFRRCSYVAKSSKQTCTQAIPKHEDREYCNNHMQVLGMLPRKEKKSRKEKLTDNNMLSDIKIPFRDRVKSRLNIGQFKNDSILQTNSNEDPDDPYAFPESFSDSKVVTTVVQPTTPSPAGDSPSSANSIHVKSPAGDSNHSAASSIAKFYPELAEKLEKIKPKNDIVKLKDKGKDKSSRTMNSLQTRIAQNRIKSKRRSTQESSSQSQSPLHLGKSPLHSGSLNNMYDFGGHLDLEKVQKTPPAYNHFDASPTENQKSANVPGIELKRPPPNYFRQPFDKVQNQPQTSSPVVTVSTDQKLSMSVQPSVSHIVPPGVPQGTPLHSLPGIPKRIAAPQIPNSIDLTNMTNASFLQNLAAYNLTKNQLLASLPPNLIPAVNQQGAVPFINLAAASVAQNIFQPMVEQQQPQSRPSITEVPVRPPPPLMCPSGLTNPNLVPSGGESNSTKSVAFTASSQQIRPPPPPYSSAVAQTKNKVTVSGTATTKTTPSKPVVNVIPSISPSLMSAKPSKIKHALSEKEMKEKIDSDMARKYYNAYLKRKIYNHALLKTGVDSCSDDSSDDERNNLMPWQPKWFLASSDEEGPEEEEDQNNVIRTTKLALLRSRLRRHCSQARKAFKGNVGELKSHMSETAVLIDAAREGSRPTVCAIKERLHEPKPVIHRYKRRGLTSRQCLYKNDDEVQCPNPVVPCANHCNKHIMYNIDQQLFDYCTAKTDDNVQCCFPVIDITHDLPLCVKHARKNDEMSKNDEEEIKPKRPRKKTKPSALTRPPKKGKKKRNQRKSTQLQSQYVNVEETPGDSEPQASVDVDMEHESGSATEESEPEEESQPTKPPTPPPSNPSPPQMSALVRHLPQPTAPIFQQKSEQSKDILGELPDSVLAANLPADLNINKGLELPLEQASRLLEQEDFHDVLNKIPDDTFDIFTGKNGEPTKEEMDELERHLLAAANMDLSIAQQTLSSTSDYDEQVRILASLLTNQPTGSETVNQTSDEQENINRIANSLATSANQASSQSYQHSDSPQGAPGLMSVPPVDQGQFQQVPSRQVLQNGPGPVHIGSSGPLQQQLVPGPVSRNSPVQTGSPGLMQQSVQAHHSSPGPVHVGSPGVLQHQIVSRHQGSPGPLPVGGQQGLVFHNSTLKQVRAPQLAGQVNRVSQVGSPVNRVSQVGSPVNRVSQVGSPVNHVPSSNSQQTIISSLNTIQNINQTQLPHYLVKQGNLISSSIQGTPHLMATGLNSNPGQPTIQNVNIQRTVAQSFQHVNNSVDKINNVQKSVMYNSNFIQEDPQIQHFIGTMLKQQAQSVPSSVPQRTTNSLANHIIHSSPQSTVQSAAVSSSHPVYQSNNVILQSHNSVMTSSENNSSVKSNRVVTTAKPIDPINLGMVQQVYQNGFVNDIKLPQNCVTDPHLLQTLAQSLTPPSQLTFEKKTGVTNSRLAQTGTSS